MRARQCRPSTHRSYLVSRHRSPSSTFCSLQSSAATLAVCSMRALCSYSGLREAPGREKEVRRVPIGVPQRDRCAFCSNLQGANRFAVVEELPETVAFLPPRQSGLGHVLVIPRRHAPTLDRSRGRRGSGHHATGPSHRQRDCQRPTTPPASMSFKTTVSPPVKPCRTTTSTSCPAIQAIRRVGSSARRMSSALPTRISCSWPNALELIWIHPAADAGYASVTSGPTRLFGRPRGNYHVVC